jgi:hypothetical protein
VPLRPISTPNWCSCSKSCFYRYGPENYLSVEAMIRAYTHTRLWSIRKMSPRRNRKCLRQAACGNRTHCFGARKYIQGTVLTVSRAHEGMLRKSSVEFLTLHAITKKPFRNAYRWTGDGRAFTKESDCERDSCSNNGCRLNCKTRSTEGVDARLYACEGLISISFSGV